MTQPFARLAGQYRFNETLLEVLADGFSPGDWGTRAGESNSAHWILGHLAHSRRDLLRHLGRELELEPWEALFRGGSAPEEHDVADYPAPSELAADFRARGAEIAARLCELTDAEAGAPWGSKLPHGDATLGGGARFLFMHESYHLGQLGLLRRAAGRPGFI